MIGMANIPIYQRLFHHPITLIPALNSILQAFPSSLPLIKLFIALCARRHHSVSFPFTLFCRAFKAHILSELTELISYRSFRSSYPIGALGAHIILELFEAHILSELSEARIYWLELSELMFDQELWRSYCF